MRKGTIKRPPGARDPIIRFTGTTEPTSEETVFVDTPWVPASWEDVFKDMFRENIPMRKRRRKSQ